MTKRTKAKQNLRKIGHENSDGKFLAEFKGFLKKYNLQEEPLGILFEYAIAYILGVFQQFYDDYFFIEVSDYLDDKEKVDFVINKHRLQIKINWDESKLCIDKDIQYRFFAIKLLSFHTKDSNGRNSCGMDILREILAACGFTEALIERNIDNPGFDAAEEILSNWLFN